MSSDERIDVRKYDAAARALRVDTPNRFQRAVADSGLAMSTVEKIWDGTISRPAVVVLKRLRKPQRCPECGLRCRDWPCVPCEMQRRKKRQPDVQLRFIYASATR